jgi:hypothetical protein
MKNLLLVVVFLAGASQRVPELQLNLVAAPPPPERLEESGRVHEGCGVGTSGGPPTPFRVMLADTDRLAYEVGDAMSFNIIVENISTAPLVLGISRDPDVAPKTMRPCRVVPPGVHFNVALVAVQKTGATGGLIATASGYYGSPNVPGTSMELQPGERVRVQLPAEIRPVGMEPILTTDPQPVRIKAFVMIKGKLMQGAYSDTTVEIELSQRYR